MYTFAEMVGAWAKEIIIGCILLGWILGLCTASIISWLFRLSKRPD